MAIQIDVTDPASIAAIDPGAVTTEFNSVAAQHAVAGPASGSVWSGLYDPVAMAALTEARAISPEEAAAAIVAAATAKRPKPRQVVPAKAKRLIFLGRWLTTVMMDDMIRRRAKLVRRA